MPTYRRPGVYINEINDLPTAVAQVETAIPAFVGYTEQAELRGKSLLYRAYRIRSMTEYERVFGLHAAEQFDWANANDPLAFQIKNGRQQYYLKRVNTAFQLYKSIKLFFQNGGGDCYVVSVGSYEEGLEQANLSRGIKALTKELAPTLLAIPDAISLAQSASFSIQNEMLQHCANMQNRVAILDVYQQNMGKQGSLMQDVQYFRNQVGNATGKDYAAAYAPYLHTMVIPDTEINLSQFCANARKQLTKVLLADIASPNPTLKDAIGAIATPKKSKFSEADINNLLLANSRAYVALIGAIKEMINIAPPSGAVVGAIVQTDASRGVWKAPANISLSGVISTTISIDTQEQELLNSDISGKSINAIRIFPGQGALVWGARTLDANNREWRYINVRRTVIMIKQSVQLQIKTYVFEANDADTWATIKTSVNNFLKQLWQNGALYGTKPSDAFAVQIGLNITMSENDLAQGNLILLVMLAMERPSEFFVLKITQKMQTT